MKITLIPLLSLFLSMSLIAADLTPEQNEIKKETELFWSLVESKAFDKAGQYIFKASDDSELDMSKLHAERAKEEFDKLAELIKSFKEKTKLGEISVRKIVQQQDRSVAPVELQVWEPIEKEYESLTIAWIKTKSSGWKIIDL